MIAAFPQLRVEVAWPNNPFDSSPTWSDVSPWVAEAHTRVGAPPLVGTVEPATMDVLVRNLDNRFDPLWTGGPYGSGVDLGRRIRATAVLKNLLADSSFESGTTAGWTAATGTTVANSTAQAVDGTHSLLVTATASGTAIAISPTVVGGGRVTVNAYARAVSTSRTMEVDLVCLDIAGNVIGSVSGPTAVISSSGWGQAAATLQSLPGTAFVRINVGFLSAASSDAFYVDGVGILPSAGPVVPWALQTTYPVFDGYIDAFQEEWRGDEPWMRISASDMVKILHGIAAEDPAAYSALTTGTANLWLYWRQNEGAGVATVADSSGNSRTGTWSSTNTAPIQGALIADRDKAADYATIIGSGHYNTTRWIDSTHGFTGTGACGVGMWVRLKSRPNGTDYQTTHLWEQATGATGRGNAHNLSLIVTANGHVQVVVEFDSSRVYLEATGIDIADGLWHLVLWYNEGGTSNPTHHIYVDGVERVNGHLLDAGVSNGINFNSDGLNGAFTVGVDLTHTQTVFGFDGESDELVMFAGSMSSNGLGYALAAWISGRGRWMGQTSQGRISLLLGLAGVPGPQTAIDAGGVTLATAPDPLWEQSIGAAIEDARVSEQGRTYVTPAGVFTSKVYSSAALTSSLTIGSSGIPYDNPPQVKTNVDEVINQIAVSLPNQTTQTANNPTSMTRYATRGQYPTGTTVSTQLASTTDAANLAFRILTAAKDSHPRVNDIPLSGPAIANSSPGWPALLARWLYDGVTVQRYGTGATRSSVLAPIEGLNHDVVGQGRWDVTVRLAPGDHL